MKVVKTWMKSMILLLTVVLLLASCKAAEVTPAPPAPEKVVWVTIGELSDLTGPTASTQADTATAYRAFISAINDDGGIKVNGKTIKLRHSAYDTAYSIPRAKEAWAKLSDEGAVVVIHCLSALAEALLPDLEAAKVPCVTGSVGPSSSASDWYYATTLPGSFELTPTWMVAMTQLWQKEGKPGKPEFGFIGADLPFVPLYTEPMKPWLEREGLTIHKEIFPADATDVSAQLTRLMGLGVDEIYVAGSVSHAATVATTAKRIGCTVPLTINMALAPRDVLNAAGKQAVEGVRFDTWYIPPMAVSKELQEPPGLTRAKERWQRAAPNEPFPDGYGFSYSGIEVVKEGLRLALEKVAPEQITGETLKSYGLDRISNFDLGGISYPITYRLGDHKGPNHFRYWVSRDGVLYALTDWVQCTSAIDDWRQQQSK